MSRWMSKLEQAMNGPPRYPPRPEFEAWIVALGNGVFPSSSYISWKNWSSQRLMIDPDYDSAARYQRDNPGRLRVNLDVFTLILSYLGQAELSVLMQTCKTLYTMALPLFCAKYHEGRMSWGSTKTLQFLVYMLAATGDRIAHLRYLELVEPPQSSNAGALLSDLLCHAGSLHTLCLWDWATWLWTEPRIAASVVSCKALRVLKLGEITSGTEIFMQQLRDIPLQSITLEMPALPMDLREEPERFLQYHTASLLEIEVRGQHTFEPSNTSLPRVIWPLVKRFIRKSGRLWRPLATCSPSQGC